MFSKGVSDMRDFQNEAEESVPSCYGGEDYYAWCEAYVAGAESGYRHCLEDLKSWIDSEIESIIQHNLEKI